MSSLRAVLGFALVSGCTAAPIATAQCSFTSECQAPLVCDNGQCRPQCQLDRDCPPNQRCVASGQPPVNACVASDAGSSDAARD